MPLSGIDMRVKPKKNHLDSEALDKMILEMRREARRGELARQRRMERLEDFDGPPPAVYRPVGNAGNAAHPWRGAKRQLDV